MPIWITETNEKAVIDLIADLNTSDGDSASNCTHPVSGCPFISSVNNWTMIASPASGEGTLLGKEDV